MKITSPRDAALVAQGKHSAIILAVITRNTRKGELTFLRCRIPSRWVGEGQEVDYLLPRHVKVGTHFHRFLVLVLGSLEIGEVVDPQRLVGKACIVHVKHVSKRGRVYANAVSVAPQDEQRRKT